MQSILETVLPIFGLILCGYLVGRKGWMSEEAIKGLNTFVFYFAIPALLFRAMARGPGLIEISIVGAYMSAIFVTFVVALGVSRLLFRTNLAERTLFGMGSTFSNTVLLGIPLIFTALGDEGGVQLMLIITFHSIVIFPVITVLIELGLGAGQGWRSLAVNTVKALAVNPIILALVAGIAFGASGLTLPAPAERFTVLLGSAAAPCALFALGATLTGFTIAGDLRETLAIVVMKLFVHPAVMAVMAFYVFDLTPLAAVVAILTAAIPSGANVFIMARQYNIYLARSASAVLISTALSVVTLSILLAVLKADL
ncbi:AEC family transporter [Pelagibius litoralis]|uniref:AEC family transporter n=1 Tax=Pelagibius litoralis TaxID=374515 RepID=A0A967F015_9PROT|nr:AEC family transporter [Pelagibius litoralis]NIA70536.1 AEC family transporter [Pelagibius litoralis]